LSNLIASEMSINLLDRALREPYVVHVIMTANQQIHSMLLRDVFSGDRTNRIRKINIL
jgi:hypothetical protein